MSSHATSINEILNQRAFAVDYRFGEEFFDLGGRIAKRVLEENQELIFERSPDATCRFTDKRLNLTLTVTAGRVQLLQTASLEVEDLLPVGMFAARAQTLFDTVLKILNAQTFSRIGHQVTFLYPYAGSSASQNALRELAIMRLPDDITSDCGQIDEMSRILTFIRPDSLMRVAVSGFEQAVTLPAGVVSAALAVPHQQKVEQHRVLMDKLKAERMIKKRPQFGIQIEMDSFVHEPREIAIVDFVEQTDSDMNNLRPLLLRKST